MPTLVIGNKLCHYQDKGKGTPVLFGHGYLWNSEMWRVQMDPLSQHFRCIAVDLWDHGKSGHLGEEPYSLEQLAEDHWNLLKALKITECIVVGLSIGGMWGTHLALKHPQNVKGLVLLNTYVGAEPLIPRQKYLALLKIIEAQKSFNHFLLNQVVPLFFSSHTLLHQRTLVDAFRKRLTEIKKENFLGLVTIGKAIFLRKCILDELPHLKQPTLIIAGKEDIPRPPKESETMAKKLSNATLHIIENAGHMSNIEQPEKVGALLYDFLKKELKA